MKKLQRRSGNIFAMLMGAVALVGVVGAGTMNMVVGPVTTASKVTHQNMADSDLMTNSRVVVMNAATLTDGGDIDADGYVEPAPFIPTGGSGCSISLPGAGGCLPADIGASLTDPWGTQYAYCVWDHGSPNTSTGRIRGEDSTSGAVIALITAGPDKVFQTPCSAYDGDPDTNDTVVDADGLGDDRVRIYTYDGAVAGAGGLWSLKEHTPDTAVISKKLEVGDVSGGTGFTFDTTTGTGEFPSVKTDYLASMSGGSTPISMASNIALDGMWLSGDGGNEGVFVDSNGLVMIGTTTPLGNAGGSHKLHIAGVTKISANSGQLVLLDKNSTDTEFTGGTYFNSDEGLFTLQGINSSGSGSAVHFAIDQTTGNVGVGTNAPDEKFSVGRGHLLHTGGNIVHYFNAHYTATGTRFTGYSGSNPLHAAWLNFNPSDGWLNLSVSSNTGVRDGIASIGLSNGIHLTKDGNVGIGTSDPLANLHIDGVDNSGTTAALRVSSGGQTVLVDGNEIDAIGTSPAALYLQHNTPNDIVLVTGGGKVGIGTAVPERALHVAGNIRVDGSYIYFANNESFRGVSSAAYWKGNHSTVTQMIFQDAEGTSYGRVYGGSDGLYFGLMDGDGHWSIFHAKDTYSDFRINNTSEMTLYPTYLHMRNNQIKYVAYPTAGSDAATKQYVDNNIMAGLNCAGGQVPKWNGSAWVCSADNVGDDLGDGGSTAGTLYSKNSSGYGYVGADSNDYIRFDDNGQAFWQINGRWEYQAYPNGFSPYYNAENDLGTPSKRWRDAWLSGELTVSSIVNDRAGGSYDIWIQGGASGASGNARNLGILGVMSSDQLYINHSSEYTGGTVIGGPVIISGGALNMSNNPITSSAGTIRDANGGWVRTYGNEGWYSATHGGGWYMTDSSYVRTYGNTGVYSETTGHVPSIYGYNTGSHYGVYGYSAGNSGVYGLSSSTYGINGRTTSASHGGVIGYSGNAAIYGILGHANAYSLYGNGQIYVSSHIRTGGQVRTNTICNASGGNCLSQSNLGGSDATQKCFDEARGWYSIGEVINSYTTGCTANCGCGYVTGTTSTVQRRCASAGSRGAKISSAVIDTNYCNRSCGSCR